MAAAADAASRNALYVRTQRAAFVSGERVAGRVYVALARPLADRGPAQLRLTLRGVERVQWSEVARRGAALDQHVAAAASPARRPWRGPRPFQSDRELMRSALGARDDADEPDAPASPVSAASDAAEQEPPQAQAQQARRRVDTVRTLNGGRTFAEETQTLATFAAPGPPLGQRWFAFELLLPREAPGSFGHAGESPVAPHDRFLASVRYQLVAELCPAAADSSAHDQRSSSGGTLRGVLTVCVHQAHSLPSPLRVLRASPLVAFFCFRRGRVSIAVDVRDPCPHAGAPLRLTCKVLNQSSAAIRLLRLVLMRRERFSLPEQREFVVTQAVCTVETGGCARRSSVLRDLVATVPRSACASTSGLLVSCEYWAEVHTDVPWTPDVVVPVPIVVRDAPPLDWDPLNGVPDPDSFVRGT